MMPANVPYSDMRRGQTMSLDDALHEVLIEDACRALCLDERTTTRVLQIHRHNPGLLRTMLEHKSDHAGYVRAKLEIMRALGIN
jgi:hypothetical protein